MSQLGLLASTIQCNTSVALVVYNISITLIAYYYNLLLYSTLGKNTQDLTTNALLLEKFSNVLHGLEDVHQCQVQCFYSLEEGHTPSAKQLRLQGVLTPAHAATGPSCWALGTDFTPVFTPREEG